jgi:uncharacterized protein (DUF2235 family)
MTKHSPRNPKNVVLLSDGTGNSSAKLIRTNVWRLYEAVDVSQGDQVAMYDNGVGTSSFKPLAVLGGALGWGLKRNVRDLYMFACRNYQPGTDLRKADDLYAFGFSRGAFTIRVLVGLIQHQGLITGVHGPELERLAKWAYRDYRRQFKSKQQFLLPLFRAVRDVLFRLWEWRKPRYDSSKNLKVEIRFVGLWDTVDAYGLPVDEMTRGWDRWIWPLSMCERTVKNVRKVCHAVALDDERHTFHPLLLDEAKEPLQDHTDKEAVTQVWFAGVHSNVGGGYPDDSLAHVSLRWMAEEAIKHGLRLHPAVTEQWKSRLDPHGQLYDSRRGLGAYYRYNPRSIKKLTTDRFAGVSIARPKIHHTVFDRIAGGREDYAPIVLPERYAVVCPGGAILDGLKNPYEHPSQARSRCADQERAWNLVWLRRALYFTTVILTAILVLPPFIVTPDSVKEYLASIQWARLGMAEAVVNALRPLAPSMLQPWVEFYSQLPEVLAVLGIPIILLMWLSSRVQRRLENRMWRLWDAIVSSPPHPVVPSSPPTDPIYRLRTSGVYQTGVELVTQRIYPFAFGVATFIAFAVIISGTVNRAGFAMASAGGFVCHVPEARNSEGAIVPIAIPVLRGSVTLSLNARKLCHNAKVTLENGVTYRARTLLPGNGWWDGGEMVTSPAGFSSGDNLFVLPWLPFRRVLRAQWYVPIARVGNIPTEHHPLNKEEVIFTPRVKGPLFLFVNDAVFVWPRWGLFYRNNRDRETHGVQIATIVIERLGQAPRAPGATSGAGAP